MCNRHRTVKTVPRIHPVVHRRFHLQVHLHLRRPHPTGRQSQSVIRNANILPIRCENRLGRNQCLIRPSRSIPIPCENRVGQTQCVIHPFRSIPIRCENRLPTGRR